LVKKKKKKKKIDLMKAEKTTTATRRKAKRRGVRKKAPVVNTRPVRWSMLSEATLTNYRRQYKLRGNKHLSHAELAAVVSKHFNNMSPDPHMIVQTFVENSRRRPSSKRKR
jgi:Sin3 binding region of histone deacetylase complex subunit SAP30